MHASEILPTKSWKIQEVHSLEQQYMQSSVNQQKNKQKNIGFSLGWYKFHLLVSIPNNQINRKKIINQMNNNSNQAKSTIKVENEDKTDLINHQPQCPIPCLQSNPSFQQRSAKSDPSNSLPSIIKDKYKTNTRFEEWSVEEVVRLFEIYEEHGSQWKFFQQWFPDRSTNSIKNRFYTALRNTFKALFREHKSIQGKLPHQIPSKDLIRLFEGREEFERFANIGKVLMMEMNYTANPRTAKIVCQKYADTILQIFTVIYGLELHEITQKLVDEQRPPIAEPIKIFQKKSQENNPPAASMQNNCLFYPYTFTGNENCYLYYSYPVIYYYQ